MLTSVTVIPQCPGYGITEDGRILGPGNKWGNHPKWVKPWTGPGGYQYVTTARGKKWRVHRLVAFAYLGLPASNTLEVRHLNDDPTDNRASNLAWGTHADNYADQVASGTAFKMPKFTLEVAQDIRKRVAAGETQKALAQEYQVDPATVSQIVRGKTYREALKQHV